MCLRALVCLCVYVLFFLSLFPPALKAALHHPPPLYSPSCFDLCYQGNSCVRLMVFFSGYSGFPIHPLGCLELNFCSSFSKVGLNLGRIVYLRIFLASPLIRFLLASFPIFFKLRTIQQKTVKPTYLLSVRCQEAGGRKRARDCLDEKRRRA